MRRIQETNITKGNQAIRLSCCEHFSSMSNGCTVCKTHAVIWTPCCKWEHIPASVGSGIKLIPEQFSNTQGLIYLHI